MFEESVEWEEFSHFKIVKETIESWLDSFVVNNAMIFRLNTFMEMARREKDLLEQNEGIEAEDWEVLKWRAMFKYSVARNVGKIFKGEIFESIQKFNHRHFTKFKIKAAHQLSSRAQPG